MRAPDLLSILWPALFPPIGALFSYYRRTFTFFSRPFSLCLGLGLVVGRTFRPRNQMNYFLTNLRQQLERVVQVTGHFFFSSFRRGIAFVSSYISFFCGGEGFFFSCFQRLWTCVLLLLLTDEHHNPNRERDTHTTQTHTETTVRSGNPL